MLRLLMVRLQDIASDIESSTIPRRIQVLAIRRRGASLPYTPDLCLISQCHLGPVAKASAQCRHKAEPYPLSQLSIFQSSDLGIRLWRCHFGDVVPICSSISLSHKCYEFLHAFCYLLGNSGALHQQRRTESRREISSATKQHTIRNSAQERGVTRP